MNNKKTPPLREKHVVYAKRFWHVRAKRYLYAKDYGYDAWRFKV